MTEGNFSFESEGYRYGGNLDRNSVDEAEDAHAFLRTVTAAPTSFGGAAGFTNALGEQRDRQIRGAEHASERRSNTGDNAHMTADHGDDVDHNSYLAFRVASDVSQEVERGM